VATELHKGFTPLFRPDTPEDYKPVARALLDKKMQYVNECLKIKSGLTGTVSLSPMAVYRAALGVRREAGYGRL
jgi:cytoplasmic iron level regulating protein YaaA (DUF328/UPF0246 family)